MISDYFRSDHYWRHNMRRQEHLATLGLELTGRSVLELGAGVGDHTAFFLDRGCRVTSTDGRSECVAILAARFPGLSTALYDLNRPPPLSLTQHEVVYAYGILCHLSEPEWALTQMAALTTDLLLLETCVSAGDESQLLRVDEPLDDPTQAVNGIGCRPTRPWIWNRLNDLFPHVYATASQPWHEEYPLDWTAPELEAKQRIRAIFIASSRPIANPRLLSVLPARQCRAG